MTSISNSEYQQRIDRLKHAMSRLDLDGYLVTNRENMFYLTGLVCDPFERPFFLLIKQDGLPTFLVPKLEESHIQSQYDPEQVSTYWEYPAPEGQGWSNLVPELLEGVIHLGVEPSLKMEISSALCEQELRAIPLVERLRTVKSMQEIEWIKRASECAVEGVKLLLAASYNDSWVVEGFADTRKLMKHVMDASDDFNPLLSKAVMGTWAAPRSAQPHSIPKLNDVLRKHSHIALVLTSVAGYAAECERTYFTTRPTSEMRDYFQIMLEARRIGLDMVRPGVKCCEIDAATREYFEDKGMAEGLLHRTGHGLGLSYHAEAPWIAEGSDEVLQPGMVLSIEPGIYLPGVCGFRHSDTILVTEKGSEILTKSEDSLNDLIISGWKPWRKLKGKLVRRSLGLKPQS